MIVSCPKCAQPNEVGGTVSTDGTRVTCAACNVNFVVRRAATMAVTSGNRFYVRRRTGNTFGPFIEGVIASMIVQRKLDGSEDISQDGKTWASIASVPSLAAAVAKIGGPPKSTAVGLGKTQPRPPSSGELPAPREAIPKIDDLPAPRAAGASIPDLPAPRETVPNPMDLPAPREDVPRVPDLPAPRSAIPKPPPRDDKATLRGSAPHAPPPLNKATAPRMAPPVSRGTIFGVQPPVPLPKAALPDLPAPREDIPLSDDLPAPKPPSLPDLPAPREDIPLSDDLPAPKGAVPNGLTFDDFTPAGISKLPEPLGYGEVDLPAPRNEPSRHGGGGTIFGLDLPTPKAPAPAPRAPAPPSSGLDLGTPNATPDLGLDFGGVLSPGGAAEPEVPAHPPIDLEDGPTAAAAALAPPMDGPAGLSLDLDGAAAAATPDMGLGLEGATGRLSLHLPAPPGGSSEPAGGGLGSLDFGMSFDPPAPTEANLGVLPASGSGEPGAGASSMDLGLSFDGGASDATSASGQAPALGETAGDTMQTPPAEEPEAGAEAKPAAKAAGAAKATKAKGKKTTRRRGGSRTRLLVTLGAALLVGGGGAAAVVLLDLPAKLLSGPKPSEIIGTAAADIARDQYPAYARAAATLEQAVAQKPKSATLRAAAAWLWLQAAVGHADRGGAAKAEAVLAGVKPEVKATPDLRRARALLAVARERFRDVDAALGTERADAESQLVLGAKALGEGKLADAVEPLKRAAADARLLVAKYMLARAQETLGHPGAAIPLYKDILAHNAAHFGAQLALVRLASAKADPAEIAKRASALAAHGAGQGSPAEIAEAHVLAGRALRADGKVADSDAAYAKALAVDAANGPANVAVGSVLLADGHYPEALARLRAAGPTATATADGAFGMAGALLGSGAAADGDKALKAAIAAYPKDPRGDYWLGRQAELATPPLLDEAEQRYRQALKKDPKYLPASLQLASMLVRAGKAPDALAALKDAETAGAPEDALQAAFGQALLAAHDPARAKEAYKRALASTPKLEAARLGLAAAYEAGGELAEAKAELEAMLADAPQMPGLRERIAQILIKLGKKDDALAVYRDEMAKGAPTKELRVAAGDLALELGKLDEAKAIADKLIAEDMRTQGAIFLLARMLRASGRMPASLTEFKRAIAVDNRPVVHFHYGLAFEDVGKDDAAFEHFGLATGLPEALLGRGRVLYRRGDYQGASKEFEAGLQGVPNDAAAWLALGNACDRQGKGSKAESAWRSAIRLDPDNPEARFQLGRYLADHNQVAASLEHLRKSAVNPPEKAPWRTELYYQLGFAEKAKGTRPAAVAALRRYLELADEKAPARHEAEKALFELGAKLGAP